MTVRTRLRALWSRDSSALAVALVEASVDPVLYGWAWAATASAYYLDLSGHATPVLRALSEVPDAGRRALGLSMIRRLSAPWHQAVVFRVACDAAWQLTPFVANRKYAERWLRQAPVGWPVDALGVLQEAERLSGGEARSALEQMRSRLQRTPLKAVVGTW
jgi:hypothetical protein